MEVVPSWLDLVRSDFNHAEEEGDLQPEVAQLLHAWEKAYQDLNATSSTRPTAFDHREPNHVLYEDWGRLFSIAMAAEDGLLLEQALARRMLLGMLADPELPCDDKNALAGSLLQCPSLPTESLFQYAGGRQVVFAICSAKLRTACEALCARAQMVGCPASFHMCVHEHSCVRMCM